MVFQKCIDGFLTETWDLNSTCVSTGAWDPFEQFLPQHDKTFCPGHKWYACHLDTILLPPIEFYQAATSVEWVSARVHSKY